MEKRKDGKSSHGLKRLRWKTCVCGVRSIKNKERFPYSNVVNFDVVRRIRTCSVADDSVYRIDLKKNSTLYCTNTWVEVEGTDANDQQYFLYTYVV